MKKSLFWLLDSTTTSKSKWKKKRKGKAIDRIRKRMKEDIYAGKTKMSHNTEWQMGKETIYWKVWKWCHKRCHENQITYVEHKMQLQKKNESNITCHLCRTEDTTQHIMVCHEGNNTYNLLDENEKDWKK